MVAHDEHGRPEVVELDDGVALVVGWSRVAVRRPHRRSYVVSR
jgi:hypothetical protein